MPTPPRGRDRTEGTAAEPHGSLGGHTPRGSEHAGRTVISETNIWGFPLCPLPKVMCATEELVLGLKCPEQGREGRGPGLEATRLLGGNVPLQVEPLALTPRPGLRRPRLPMGKLNSTPEQCSQPSQPYIQSLSTQNQTD